MRRVSDGKGGMVWVRTDNVQVARLALDCGTIDIDAELSCTHVECNTR